MKKWIAWLLALCLLLALAGCSRSDDVRGTVTGDTESTQTETEATADPSPEEAEPLEEDLQEEDSSAIEAETAPEAEPPQETETPEDTDTPQEDVPAEETPSQETEEDAAQPALSLGSNDGTTYENTYLEIGAQLDSDWVFLTDEEILELNNMTQEMMSSEEDLAELLEDSTSLQDMYASTDEGLTTLNVVMSKMSPLETAAFAISADNLFDESYDALSSSLLSALEAMGCTQVSVSEFQDYAFAGHDGKLLQVSGFYDDTYPIYESMVMFVKGDRMVAVTACTWLEDQTLSLLDLFYSL